MKFGRPRVVLDAVVWVATAFGVLATSRLLAVVIPSEFYFTFQSLFSDRPAQNMVLAVLGKMAAPLVVGALVGWIVLRAAREAPGVSRKASFARRLRERWSPAVFLGCFFAAFVSAWPMIVYWDLLANPELVHLKPVFLLLYLLYMFAYGYVGLLGLLGAIFLREHMTGRPAGAKSVSVGELSRVGALWLLNSGIASLALEAITG